MAYNPLTPSELKLVAGKMLSLFTGRNIRRMDDLYILPPETPEGIRVAFGEPQTLDLTIPRRNVFLTCDYNVLKDAFTTIILPRERKTIVRIKASPIPLYFESTGNIDRDQHTISQWAMTTIDLTATLHNLRYLAGLKQHPFLGRTMMESQSTEEPLLERRIPQPKQPPRCRVIWPEPKQAQPQPDEFNREYWKGERDDIPF